MWQLLILKILLLNLFGKTTRKVIDQSHICDSAHENVRSKIGEGDIGLVSLSVLSSSIPPVASDAKL